MSDLEMKRAQELGLTDDDLDAAFARTMVRRNQLVAQRSRRIGVVSAFAAAALVVGAVAVAGWQNDSPTGVGSNETGTTTIAPTTTALTTVTPAGFSLSTEGGVSELRNTTADPDVPPSEVSGDVDLGSGLVTERAIDVVDSRVVPDGRGVEVQLACLRNDADRIVNVRYALSGSDLTVEATVEGGFPGDECVDAVGSSIVLPLPAGTAVPAHLRVVAGMLPGG